MPQTQIQIQSVMMTLALQGLNAQTVNEQELNEIIQAGVKDQALATIWILALDQQRQIQAKIQVDISYDSGSPEFSVTAEVPAPPDLMPPPPFGDLGGDSESSVKPEDVECQVWRESAAMFMQMARDKGLKVEFGVSFRKQDAELCRRFGLQASTLVDRSQTGRSYSHPHSKVSGLSAAFQFSTDMWPGTS